MIQRKSILLYLIGLLIAVGVIWFCAYHFFFDNVTSDSSVQHLLETQTSASSANALDCIALLGIDTDQNDTGRSDAIMLASVDREHNEIRLCSIARDSRVAIDGYGQCKLNAAYAYGGGDLTIQTLNKAFGLQLIHYVAVNFSGMAEIVDELDGVNVSLSEDELSYLGQVGEGLTAGESVRLNGEQAVAYSRIRYLDNDDVRTSRQREVLESLFHQVQQIDVQQYPALMQQLLAHCTTNLSQAQLTALLAQLTPQDTTICQHAIPSDQTKAEEKTIDGIWYYVYDTQKAGTEIRRFLEGTG